MVNEERDESERRYQQLIRTSPAPINLFDASGEVLWGNDAVVDLLGLESRAQLIGRSIFEFIDTGDRYTAEQELIDVVENETPTGPTSMKLNRADGTTRNIRVSTAPGTYRGRNIGQAVVIDVTPLNDIQAELGSERQFIDAALNTLQDVFYVINPAGKLERWNETLLDVSGYTASEIRRMEIEDLFVERDVDRISKSIETTFVEGADTVKATALTRYGNEIPFEFRKRRLTIDGTVVGLVGIGRDISARNAREQHLRAVDHILRHNLRNQLNIIQGTTGILREAIGGTDPASVDRIDASVERLLSIFGEHNRIVELLTDQETVRPVDIASVLESIAQTLREAYPDASITIDCPATLTVSVVPALEEAFFELVENAIKHNDQPEPSVEIVVDSSESVVSIHVIDDGPKIPEMEYTALRNDGNIKSTYHPTGLGLWFVHLVVKDSGGTLSFDWNCSNGNVVTIELRIPGTRWST